MAGVSLTAFADGLAPTATYVVDDTEYTKNKDETVEGDAPLLVHFAANPTGFEAGYTFVWRFVHNGVDG